MLGPPPGLSRLVYRQELTVFPRRKSVISNARTREIASLMTLYTFGRGPGGLRPTLRALGTGRISPGAGGPEGVSCSPALGAGRRAIGAVAAHPRRSGSRREASPRPDRLRGSHRPGLLQEGGDVGPEGLPIGPLGLGETRQGLEIADARQVGVGLPVLQRLSDARAGLLGQSRPAEDRRPRSELGLQPRPGLPAE